MLKKLTKILAATIILGLTCSGCVKEFDSNTSTKESASSNSKNQLTIDIGTLRSVIAKPITMPTPDGNKVNCIISVGRSSDFDNNTALSCDWDGKTKKEPSDSNLKDLLTIDIGTLRSVIAKSITMPLPDGDKVNCIISVGRASDFDNNTALSCDWNSKTKTGNADTKMSK